MAPQFCAVNDGRHDLTVAAVRFPGLTAPVEAGAARYHVRQDLLNATSPALVQLGRLSLTSWGSSTRARASQADCRLDRLPCRRQVAENAQSIEKIIYGVS